MKALPRCALVVALALSMLSGGLLSPHPLARAEDPSPMDPIYLSDAGWSEGVGEWDPIERVATLTVDVGRRIVVQAGDLTLDGAGHTISVPLVDPAEYSQPVLDLGAHSDVTVENLTIAVPADAIRWSAGIFAYQVFQDGAQRTPTGITISNCALSGRFVQAAIFLSYAQDATIGDCSLPPRNGLLLHACTGTTIERCTIDGDPLRTYGADLTLDYCDQTLLDGCTAETAPPAGPEVPVYLIANNCSGLTVQNCTTVGRAGIWLANPKGDTNVANNEFLDVVGAGISVEGSFVPGSAPQFTLSGNHISGAAAIGISFSFTGGPIAGVTVSGNTIADVGTGLLFDGNLGAQVYDNTFDGCITAIRGPSTAFTGEQAAPVVFYHNNFSNYQTPFSLWGDLDVAFSQDLPVGGNYWDQWTTPDADGNGIVDEPYALLHDGDGQPTVQDLLPWTRPSGWNGETVPPVTTATVDGTVGNDGWYTSAVQVTLAADDGEGSGVAHIDYTLDGGDELAYGEDPISLTADGTHSLTYWAEDNDGNVESPHTLEVKVDATPPTIVGAAAPAANAAGWRNAGVTVSWACDDGGSGVASCSAPETLGEGAAQSASGTAVDVAGNTATATVTGIDVDETAPTTALTLDPAVPDGKNGWYTSPVDVTLSAADEGGSGVARVEYRLDPGDEWTLYGEPFTLSADGTITLEYRAADLAGNVEDARSTPINVDLTGPVFGACPDCDTLAVGSGAIPVGPITAEDATSGLDEEASRLSGTVDTSLAGEHSVTFTAVDHAGNVSRRVCTYLVTYDLNLLYDESKAHKLGSTVPLKLQLVGAAGVNYSAPGVVVHAVDLTLLDGEVDGILEDSGNANPDLDFRYDAGLQGYIYNLCTKGLISGTWQLSFTVGDSSDTYAVTFDIR